MNAIKETLVRVHFFHKIPAKESKYLIHLFSLVILLLVSPFFTETSFAKLSFSFLISVVLISGLYADIESKRIDYIEVSLGGLAVLLTWVDYLFAGFDFLDLTTQFIYALYFLYFLIELMTKIVLTEKISPNLIYAAIVGFLVLGLLGATLASIIGMLNPASYNFPQNISHFKFENYMYYSFISITTVGYGDMTPNMPIAKTLAIFLCTSGHFYTSIIISIIIGKYINKITGNKG
ncbi:MAG: potassium channel family protein [Cytophagaceae bacterium]|jgi:hypothetical protein|nr:potassium channel family protein [Cytophagaceae bacterium]